EPGKRLGIEVTRTIVAQRLGRITGSGLFAESQKVGEQMGWHDSDVLGCDSVQLAVHNNRLFWLWGDTTLANYPLGIFDCSSATTALRPLPMFEPPIKLRFDYFTKENGTPRGVANMPGEGPTWLTAYVDLPDIAGKHHLVASYLKIRGKLEAYEKGLCVWNEAASNFERLKVVWRKGDREIKDNGEKESRTNVPEGHPLFWKDATGKDGLLFGNPFPTFRCPPTFESWQDQKTWEAIAPPQALK